MGFLDEITNLSSQSLEGKAPPPTRFVDWLHSRVSTSRDTDLHHQLGITPATAAVGNHDHEGKNSITLWDAADIPADLPATPTTAEFRDATNAILARLRQKSG